MKKLLALLFFSFIVSGCATTLLKGGELSDKNFSIKFEKITDHGNSFMRGNTRYSSSLGFKMIHVDDIEIYNKSDSTIEVDLRTIYLIRGKKGTGPCAVFKGIWGSIYRYLYTIKPKKSINVDLLFQWPKGSIPEFIFFDGIGKVKICMKKN